MNDHNRGELLAAICRDLVGPHGGDAEALAPQSNPRAPLPDDVYLTGILLPREPDRSTAEIDDEGGGVADGERDQTSDPGEAVPVSLAARPRVMGVSFSVPVDAEGIHIEGSAGRYVPFWNLEDGTRTFAQGDNDSKYACWQRQPVSFTADLKVPTLGKGVATLLPVALDLSASVGDGGGLRCHARILRQAGAMQVTITVENDLTQDAGPFGRNKAAYFQVEFAVSSTSGFVPRPALGTGTGEEDAQSNRLLYRDVHEWAVGHTCSATWDEDGSPNRVLTTWLPVQHVLTMSADGHPLFGAHMSRGGTNLASDLAAASDSAALQAGLAYIPDAYEEWLKQQEGRVAALPGTLGTQAAKHCSRAKEALSRIRGGLDALADPRAFVAFRLAQETMALQAHWKDSSRPLAWRPFQLGFQLASLGGLVHPLAEAGQGPSDDRSAMDLLWFPTGGGKTEAYLGLAAFLLFFRRLRDQERGDRGAGVSILMRYTLRLLTTQQFERAAAMILAAELVRRKQRWSKEDDLPFSVGLWVGNNATPASVYEARTKPGFDRKAKMIKNCPSCGKKLRWDERRSGPYVVRCGRRKQATGTCVLHHSNFGALPIFTIDQLVFEHAPSLLLGTVDKFAQIVRTQTTTTGAGPSDKVRRHGGSWLFGQQRGTRPPELIIQDELHLISGPLGTITAIYEAAIDRICTVDGLPPKVIGSTATIRRAQDQVQRLFDRKVFQFPPSVIDHDDSCFAVVDRKVPGRFYVGVTTAGRSAKFSLASVQASLLQRASEPAVVPKASADPWWTVLTYFNSLRELGGALVMVHDDVPAAMTIRSGLVGSTVRQIGRVTELTSRLASEEIPELLDELNRPVGGPDPQDIDVVLATNMISVGVDIARLGAMIVNGQPRSMAEYIQATSRVGRNKVPGLVITIYNAHRPRDLSRFEAFRSWHSALYREVEATSVTPYAPRAREKALHAAVVALARHLVPGLRDVPDLDAARAANLRALADCIVHRARRVDDPRYTEEHQVRDEIDQFIQRWEHRHDQTAIERYWDDRRPERALLLSWEEEARRRQLQRGGTAARPTPNSMRDVEPSVWFRLVPGLGGN